MLRISQSYGEARRKQYRFAVVLVALGALVACGDCSDEVDAANAFLADPANLSCQTDSDCQVVHTGCASLERSFCGQATLSKEAANSSEWRKIQGELNDCEGDSCETCAALLVPSCTEGSCGRP